MKRLSFLMFLCVMSFLKPVAAQKNVTNALLPKDLLMEYLAPLSDEYYKNAGQTEFGRFNMTLINKNQPQQGIDFRKIIFDQALNGKQRVYNSNKQFDRKPHLYPYNLFNMDSMSTNEVFEYAGGKMTIAMVVDAATGKKVEKKIMILPVSNSVEGIVFTEAWTFDETSFSMQKNVWGYYPVIKFFRDEDIKMEDPKYRKTFLVQQKDVMNGKNIKKNAQKSILIMKASYEFFLEDEYSYSAYSKKEAYSDISMQYGLEKMNCPFWSSYSKMKFVDMIIDNVTSGKVQPFDFESGAKLTIEQAMANLGRNTSLQKVQDSKTGTVVEKSITILDRRFFVHSVIFIENWYFNPENLYITKEVVGVAPVFANEEGEKNSDGFPLRKPAFLVYFNKSTK